ncbi:MAG: TIGR03905 family TSCPD domain-containing protein [Clostridia bacterium]|nr:TIGR03905 family TSCPD domain-containing protein [Clostridia bacterium]
METYRTSGVCSRTIDFEVENNIVTHVKFNGGCMGNTQGVAKLAEGRTVDEVISLLEGIQCRAGTSCPDQLARALKEYKANH